MKGKLSDCGMRVIFLKISLKKLIAVFAVLLVFSLSGLAIAVYQINQMESLFVAVPRSSGHYVSVNTVEEINDRITLALHEEVAERTTVSRVMLTYENRQSRSVNALQSRHDVYLIGTNHSHPHVLNHGLIHGSFFNQDALIYAHNVVVLNKTAAFKMFGNIYASGNEMQIGNTPFRVVGVVDDGDSETPNVYIPATVLGNTVHSIAANFTVNPDLTAEYIQTVWQQMGITTDHYHFINFDTLATVVRDRLILFVYLIFTGGFVLGIAKAIKAANSGWYTLNCLRREMYMVDLIRGYNFRRLVGITVGIIAMVTAVGAIWLNAFQRGLYAYASHGMVTEVRPQAFLSHIEKMVQWYNWSLMFFLCGVVLFLVGVVLYQYESERIIMTK